MVASGFDFVEVVSGDRDLVVSHRARHSCRLETREQGDLAWYCDLDDGIPMDPDKDPSSHVRWVAPALRRVARAPGGDDLPTLEVTRTGPRTDLGRAWRGIAGLVGLVPRRPPGSRARGRLAYDDPRGILDDALRRRIESWPAAWHGDGVTRAAELWSIGRTGEGLVVSSVSWWGSAPVLEHQIALALDVRDRLLAARRRGEAG